MKALWFGVMALMLTTGACEKRKGTLMPARDAQKADSKAQASATGSDRQKLSAKALPADLAQDEHSDQNLVPLSDVEAEDLQKVKQEALDRIKHNPGEKASRQHPARGKAAALFQRARQLAAQGDLTEAQDYYLVACQFGHLDGCHKFGWHEERRGNLSNAGQFYKTACESGLSKSCNNLGFQLEKRQAWDEALDFYARACLDRHENACDNLKRLREQKLKRR